MKKKNNNSTDLNFLLTGGREEEIVHLCLEGVVDLDIDVVAGCLLLLDALHADGVVDDDGVGRVQQRVQPLRDLGKLHAGARKDLLQVLVAVDELALVRVLQLVSLDVLPQGADDDRARLRVHPEQSRQSRVQFELQRLVVEQQQDGARHVFVSGSLHLAAHQKEKSTNVSNREKMGYHAC
jgi:hypothetical protein